MSNLETKVTKIPAQVVADAMAQWDVWPGWYWINQVKALMTEPSQVQTRIQASINYYNTVLKPQNQSIQAQIAELEVTRTEKNRETITERVKKLVNKILVNDAIAAQCRAMAFLLKVTPLQNQHKSKMEGCPVIGCDYPPAFRCLGCSNWLGCIGHFPQVHRC